MDQLDIISTALKVHHLTNLNTYIIDQSDELFFHHEIVSIPTFMPGSKDEDIFNLHTEMKQQNSQLYSYTNSWGLHYLGYSFSIDRDYSVIIGPYLELTPNLFNLTRLYHLSNNDSENLRILYDQIQILSVEKTHSYSSILQLFDIIVKRDITPIHIKQNKDNDTYYRKNESNLIEEDASKIVHLRYKIESELLHAIELGNKTKGKELINSENMLFSFSERFPNQPLRRVKNLAIVLNTLLRTVAIKNRVAPILIHRTSEKYALQIENKTRLVELQQLQNEMIEEYSDLVVSNSLSHYSIVTQKAITHIMTYYDKPIDTKELADICFAHPSHLSRKFKQETNMTITAYQQKIRIQEATHLLKNESMPIEEIAWMVGYGDSSYFTRVFKRETGYTPSQYRKL